MKLEISVPVATLFRIEAFGHTQWMTSAENIAAGNSDGASTFEQWKNSPGHDRNMRNPDFTSIGIGRVEVPGSYYTFYWTTNFSDFIDGNGDCTRDDPSDYGDTDGDNNSGDHTTDGASESGGCASAQGASLDAPRTHSMVTKEIYISLKERTR